MARSKTTRARLALSNTLTCQELKNDLEAARRRLVMMEEANENLRQAHAAQSNELIKAHRDRIDWQDAFKLIMRLVK